MAVSSRNRLDNRLDRTELLATFLEAFYAARCATSGKAWQVIVLIDNEPCLTIPRLASLLRAQHQPLMGVNATVPSSGDPLLLTPVQ